MKMMNGHSGGTLGGNKSLCSLHSSGYSKKDIDAVELLFLQHVRTHIWKLEVL
jgi:hypothetical protein